MKRVMIWFGAILSLMVLALAALLVLLPFVLDPNDYRAKIENLVHDKSGYQLRIPGDIDLTITPALDVLLSLGQIQVQSAAEFPDVILFSSEKARVELSLMPLLREKRLAIQGIQLHGVYCNLIRNRAGKGNWEVSTTATSADPVNSGQSQEKSGKDISGTARKTASPSFDLGSLDLSKIDVRYEDQLTNKRFELKNFSVQTGRVQDGQPFHLQSAFTLISSADRNAALSIESRLESDVTVTVAEKTVGLNSLTLQSTVDGFGIRKTDLQLTLDGLLDFAKKDVSLKNATLHSGLLQVQLNAEITDFSNPAVQGTLVIQEFSLRQFLADNALSQPPWKGDSALTRVGLSCTLAGDKKKITVSDIEVALDGAQAKGGFVLSDLAHPSYDLKLRLDRLDLDRYATVPAVEVHAAVASSGKELGGDPAVSGEKELAAAPVSVQPLFPVEMLRQLRFTLDLAADTMQIRGARLSQIELKAEGNDGLLQLNPLRAELYGGSISAESTLDVRGDTPQLLLQKSLDQVQIGALLKDMTGKEEISGTAVLSLQLQSQGDMKEQLMANANGKMNLSFDDGVIQKLHILQVIRQTKALYEGELAVAAAEDEPTGFAHISATAVITDGVFVNEDLQAASDLMNVTGSGKVDLAEEYVDYLLKVSLTRGIDRDEKSGKTDFSKLVIPYRVHGKFSELKEEADIVDLLKSQAQNLLMDKLQKHLQPDDSGTKSGTKKSDPKKLLEQGLKSLFGN